MSYSGQSLEETCPSVENQSVYSAAPADLAKLTCCLNELINRISGISPRGVVANVLDYDIVVSEIEHQSLSNVYFQTNTLGKGVYILIPPAMG